MKLSRAQAVVLSDLQRNGPVTLHPVLRWPERNGERILYQGNRVTSQTFDALENRKLVMWEPAYVRGFLTRIYRAAEEGVE